MIAFRVSKNGEQLCTAGIENRCVLTAIATYVDVVDPGPKLRRTLELTVGGLDSETEQSMNWVRADLATGDHVEIDVISTDDADAPAHISNPQTKKGMMTDALQRIRGRRKALLRELKMLEENEKAYSRELETQKGEGEPRKRGRRLPVAGKPSGRRARPQAPKS